MEKKIADFYEQDDTLTFTSCYGANESVFEALLGKDDAVFTDKLNHASIINGIRLCKAKRYLYDNNSLDDLEKQLKSAKDSKYKLIATDGVFSMDGTMAHLKGICDLADQYGAIVYVDECHGTGVVGERGRGAVEYHGVLDRVDMISSTLGKALGGINGGFITGKKDYIDYLR